MAKKYKRRNFFIKRDFQGKLILTCFLFVAGAGLLVNVLLGLLSADSLTILYADRDLQLGQTPWILFKHGLAATWIMIMLGGGFVVLASLFLSHRIAGPMHHFEMTLDRMQDGQLDTAIHLRDKDEGKELAQKINDFNELLLRSFHAIRDNTTALDYLLEQASALELPEQEKKQLAGLCLTMQDHLGKITKECNYFCSRDE